MSEEQNGISRRDMLKATGIAAVAAGSVASLAGCTTQQAEAEELPKAMGHIESNTLKCSGCKTCMIVCGLNHGNATGPNTARLKVVQASIDLFNTTITTCKQCNHPECYYACQESGARAMYIDEKTGARVIDETKCVGCLKCVKACPQYPNTPIWYNKETGTCFKCDLCGGDPQCVKYCPMSANWADSCYPEAEHPLRFTGTAVQE